MESCNTRLPSTGRRRFIAGASALALAPLVPSCAGGRGVAPEVASIGLRAAPGAAQLRGATRPATAVWAYNGVVPGPVLRVRQGQRLRIEVENALDEATTVHWHGVRVPNAMDGVPYITQPPIAPRGRFVYEFDVPDAGSYWYHPHQRSFEQSARGLHGALIVEEREPLRVDHDVVWLLEDWRLNPDGSIRGGFGSFMDVSHNGRVGNTVTVNGRVPEPFAVRSGERIRLRLINAANARIFALGFEGHRPRIVALDGQPVEPHEPGGPIVLGPAMRADLVIDMGAAPGARFEVRDHFYKNLEYRLTDIVYSNEAPLRAGAPDWPVALPRNPLDEPDIGRAERHWIVFTGGMMGDMSAVRRGMAWAVNGVSHACGDDRAFDPLLWLKRGRSYVLRLVNDTAWHHPMHLHGHSFRVLSRNDRPTRHREWQDTVLVSPRETVEIAFVADNPGDWMFHCHVLEHQVGGMMACVRVM